MKELYQIAIVTLAEDLHGIAIQKALQSYDNVKCHIIESDRICGNPFVNWSNNDYSNSSNTLLSREKDLISVKQLDVIWWRRFNYSQKVNPEITDDIIIDLINNECNEALLGLMINEFSGIWINEPSATRRAENKLIQLKIAEQTGFHVPKTIVSQDPKQIRKFCEVMNNDVIVKPIKGTNHRAVFTRRINEEHLKYDYSIKLAPVIYQEYIPGYKHIRAHCFGDSIYAALIETEELDWRENLNIPFRKIDLDKDLKNLIRAVVKNLGLRMGIIDLKISEDSVPLWLEINPQGQFLFIEGMTGLDLISYFAKFLYLEAKRSQK